MAAAEQTAAGATQVAPLAAAPTPPVHDARLGLGLAAGAGVLFGTSYIATALAMPAFSPLAVAAWRGIGATLLLLVASAGRRRLGALIGVLRPSDLPRLALLGLLGGPGLMVGMNLAIVATGATIAAFVAGLYAVLAAVLAPLLLRERLGAGTLAGFLLALSGTALLAELERGAPAWQGIVAGLAAAVSYALYLVLSRRWATRGWGSRGRRIPGETVTLALFTTAAVVLLPLDLILEPGRLLPVAPDPLALGAIAWLVVFPSLVANVMIQASVRRIAARRSSSLLLLNPVAASLLAALLLGERLAPLQLLGAALVLAGIAVSNGLVGRPGARATGTAPGVGA